MLFCSYFFHFKVKIVCLLLAPIPKTNGAVCNAGSEKHLNVEASVHSVTSTFIRVRARK